jgi:hypothetical protein
MRRIVLDWEDQTTREKADTTEKLFKALRHDAPRSEILAPLKDVMEEYQDERDEEINESLGADVYKATVLKEFDLSKQLEWIKQDNLEWRGTFTVGQQKFLILIDKQVCAVPGRFIEVTGMRVDFALLGPDANPLADVKDMLPHIKDSNTGEARTMARTIFSYVLAGSLQYIRAKKPACIRVEGLPEKMPTYLSMARFLRPMLAKEGYSVMRNWATYQINFWRDDLNVQPKEEDDHK